VLVMQAAANEKPFATRANGGGTSMLAFTKANEKCPASVQLIDWALAGGQEGRIVDQDDAGQLIPVVCSGSKRYPTNFLAEMEGVKVLLKATGVTWNRAPRKGVLRVINSLPKDWAHLQTMWKAALASKADLDQLSILETDLVQQQADNGGEEQTKDTARALESLPCLACCQVCGSQNPIKDERSMNALDMDPVRTCPLCLISAHATCSKHLLEYAQDAWKSQKADSANESGSSSSSASATTSGRRLSLPSRKDVTIPGFFISEKWLAFC